MKKSRVLTAVTATAGLLCSMSLTACSTDEAASGNSCDGAKVKIASAPSSFVYMPLYVAQGAGYLEDEGLEVEKVDLTQGSGIIAGAVSNSVDIALSTLAEVAVARDEGAPVTAFAQATDFATNVVMKKSVMKEKGITEDSSDEEKIAALEGLRIGVTGAGSGTDLLIRYLAKVGGLDPEDDMNITASGSGSNSVASFSSDRFDAIAISSPQSDVAIERGDGAYLFNVAKGDYKPLVGNVYIVALASDRTIEKRPKVLGCFTSALARAQKELHENPEQAAKVAQEFLGDIDPKAYQAAFQNNLQSWPNSPVIDEDGARAALDFQNKIAGTDLGDEAMEGINYEIAEEATK